MIYRLRHLTRYAYAEPVDLAAHVLHLRPRPLPGQRVLSESLHADPEPARRCNGTDHFGNRVTWFFLDRPHPRFQVTSEAVVEVTATLPPATETTQPWEDVAAAARAGGAIGGAWQAAEYLFDSPMAPSHAAAGHYAAPSFPRGRPVLEALRDLTARITAEFTFRPGTTTLATPLGRVLEQRSGVCQDFSHLMIGALRALGLPARYVSGYVLTRPPPGEPRRLGADQSHAWVGCWLGSAHGWIGLDPTNGLVVRDEHVTLGWGRDYGDVSPMRGVILGGGAHEVTVAVDLEPIEPAP